MSKVKCGECGFLALRHTSRELREAEESFRQKGEPPTNEHGHKLYEALPLCFVREFDLRKEIDEPIDRQPMHSPQAVLRSLRLERECISFTKWIQGFSPKEHAEMLQEQARLHWQARREDEDRIWRTGQEDKADKRHGENLKAVVVAGRSNVWSAIVAAVLGAVVGAWAARINVPSPATPAASTTGQKASESDGK